jgi:hypothetical protein
LKQVEIGSVVGELDVDRGPERFLENFEDVADVLDERRRVDEAAEIRDQLVLLWIDEQRHGFVEHIVFEHREDLFERGVFRAVVP